MKKHSKSRVGEEGAQYTVRGIPAHVDRALRRKADRQKKSLNEVLCEVLAAGAGEGPGVKHHDLDHLAGRWKDDPDFEAALAAQDQIDESLWR